jgi:hypothetical protein
LQYEYSKIQLRTIKNRHMEKRLFCVRFVLSFDGLEGLKAEGKVWSRPIAKETEKIITFGRDDDTLRSGTAFDYKNSFNKDNLGKLFGEGVDANMNRYNKIIRKLFCYEGSIDVAKKQVREAVVSHFNEIQADIAIMQHHLDEYQLKRKGVQLPEGTF